MKLWLLRPCDKLPSDDNPWDPWFDKAFGFVIDTDTEAEARKFANDNSGDEKRGEFMGSKIAETQAPWLEAKYSTCVELTADREPGIVITDFHSA